MIKAILLAAGQSKRLKSENKLIKKFKNKALINHPLKALFKSKVEKIIIVLGYQNKEVRKVINKSKKNETLFLSHLQKVIDNKKTNADHMISKFSKNEDLNELYDE